CWFTRPSSHVLVVVVLLCSFRISKLSRLCFLSFWQYDLFGVVAVSVKRIPLLGLRPSLLNYSHMDLLLPRRPGFASSHVVAKPGCHTFQWLLHHHPSISFWGLRCLHAQGFHFCLRSWNLNSSSSLSNRLG
ncbi:hypothetical protein BDZ97DRAFT_1806941, partial [Flammula alnicola]